MAEVRIIDRGCRGCTLCVDVCPVDVFDFLPDRQLAAVVREEDCIGCLSCVYACPSRCVDVEQVERLRPFHRIEGHVALIEHFLQEPSATATLGPEDYREARDDVAARLQALADAVQETMGRGHKAVGRRAGAVAAVHMPEMYEEKGLEGIVAGLERELGVAFGLSGTVRDRDIDLSFSAAAVCPVAEQPNEAAGGSVLCEIFHEYLAGMISEYAGTAYRYELETSGDTCEMHLHPLR
jgi:NAD-dependent dihydropyrimidine dehydrogenase PreA subunit